MKTSGSLCQYYRGEPALDDNDAIIAFFADNNSIALKFKEKITRQTENDGTKDTEINGTKDTEIKVTLKDLSNFWSTLEIPLINCQISLMSTWLEECTVANQVLTFTITDTNLLCSNRIFFTSR